MTKDYRLADNFKTESTRNRSRGKLIQNLVEHVELRIDDVNTNEIEELSTRFYALKNSQYQYNDNDNDNVVKNGTGKQDFVVTLKPAPLDEIKQALHVILGIVKAERIAIDT